eukprot:CAMPEP_0171474290 /NCGR_PEP_ID=MMETSP0946-20130122/2342_1 /TAXON_ID=109269 /ORGANISM="Vaucheria litorea, Strain CCMP2940" /LENGTH=501 /DNA_ID=CAMNT_0012004203 /DNA_START=23 /DNA_END=1528 /DNA_ORIENTATION=-
MAEFSSSDSSDGDESLSPQTAKELGDAKYKEKSYREAIDYYSKGISGCDSKVPELSALFCNRAAAKIMLLQFNLAVEDCDCAIAADPKNLKAYFRKAGALKKAGAFERSIEIYEAALEKDPTNNVQYKEKKEAEICLKRLARAKECIDLKRYSEVLQLSEAILNVSSTCSDAKIAKAEALISLGRNDDAYNMLTSMVRSDSKNPKILKIRGKCLYNMGNLEGALKHLSEAARYDPDSRDCIDLIKRARKMESSKERGSKAYGQGKMEEAIEAWKEALLVDPSNKPYNAKLHYNCANAFARLSKHSEAVTASNRAIHCNGAYTKAYIQRANSLLLLGECENIEMSIRDYEKAKEMADEGSKADIEAKIKKARIALKQSKKKDYYKILGVRRDAGEEDIKRAYRKAALKWHPDRQNGKTDGEKEKAEKVFREINDAYSVLSDPTKKNRYDSGVDAEDLDNPHAGHGMSSHGGIDPNLLYQMFMQQQMGGRRGSAPGGVRFQFG